MSWLRIYFNRGTESIPRRVAGGFQQDRPDNCGWRVDYGPGMDGEDCFLARDDGCTKSGTRRPNDLVHCAITTAPLYYTQLTALSIT